MTTNFNCEHGVYYSETCPHCIQEATIQRILEIINNTYKDYSERTSHTFISILKLKIEEYFKDDK